MFRRRFGPFANHLKQLKQQQSTCYYYYWYSSRSYSLFLSEQKLGKFNNRTYDRGSAGDADIMTKRGNNVRMKSTTGSSRPPFVAKQQLGSCYAQIIGLGTDTDGKDTTPSVLLFTDKRRYCFNIGEGFQRFCVEHKLKMTRLERVFFTRTTSKATGGVIGMLLTLADAAGATLGGMMAKEDDGGLATTTIPKMTVHGPNVRNLLEAVKVLVAENRGIVVERGGETFRDEICEVKPMLRVPEMIGPLGKRLNENSDNNNDNGGRIKPDLSSSSAIEELEPVVSYEVQLASPPGKFDAKKADALGVPRGKERGVLVRGESIEIELESGEKKIITPDMCVEEAGRGARFAVVDLPTKAHLDAAIQIVEKMKKCSSGWNVNEERDLVVHLAPANVANSSEYQAFVQENFANAKPKHVFANASRNERTPIFLASRAVQAKLHGVDGSIFPEPPSASKDDDDDKKPSTSFGVAGKSLLKFTLMPQRSMGIDESAVPKIETPRAIRETAAKEAELRTKTNKNPDEDKSNRKTNDEFCANHPGHKVVDDVDDNEVVVTFLGTGSAQPAKHRNVTGILLEVEKDGENYSALLDSGEGSLGQIYRSKNGNTTVVDNVLINMHFAWISHVHADHHVGLPSILAKRREAFLSSGVKEEDIPNLTVFGPRPLRWFLSQCEKIEPLSYRFVDCRDTLESKTMQELLLSSSSSSSSSFSSPFEKLVSIPVTHCAHAFGIKLEGMTNKSNLPYSIVYSGDTRPCENMRTAAKECTLLIHEATFEDGLEHEALAKKHSTTAEALEIGSSAYLNILTHFSQRYPKVPSFNGDDGIASARGQNAMIAFDLMRVDFKNLRRIPSLLPNVRELFDEEDDEED